MFKIAALAIKELKIIARDPLGLVMLFLLPAMFIVVLSVALQGAFATSGDKEKVDILIANDESGQVAQQLVMVLNNSGVFNPVEEVNEKPVTREMIDTEVLKGNYRAGIAIPRDAHHALLLERDATIDVIIDPVLSAEFAFMIKSVVEDVVSMSLIGGFVAKDMAVQAELDKVTADLPTNESVFDDVDYFDDAFETQADFYLKDRGLLVKQTYVSSDEAAKQPNEVQQNVPGWTVFALFWIAQLLAINILSERKTGAFKRILVAPVSMTQYIVGKTIPFILINMVQATLLFAIGIYILPLLGCHELAINNFGALALVTFTISLVANGFGIFMASISTSDTFAASVSAALLIIMSVVGGIMVPKFVMPEYMQTMSLMVPHGWAIECYQDILVKDYSLTQILPKTGVLLAFALAFFLFGIIKIKVTNKQL